MNSAIIKLLGRAIVTITLRVIAILSEATRHYMVEFIPKPPFVDKLQ